MVYELSISKWGPAAWHYLHAVSFTYPVEPTSEVKDNMFVFLHSFAKTIPCSKCKTHFETYLNENLKTKSPSLDSRDNLIEFINTAHNSVNKRLGKKIYSLEECKDRFLSVKPETSPLVSFLLFISLLTLIILLVKRYKKRRVR